MPISIQNLVIHKLIKDQHGTATVDTSAMPMTVNEPAQRLIDQLHQKYSEHSSKGYGKFSSDERHYPMPDILRQWFFNRARSFQDTAKDMLEHLRVKADNEPLATGGHVLVAHVQSVGTDYMLVAIITDVLGTAIVNGSIVDSTHVDLNAFRVAGRINLTQWNNSQNTNVNYISFLKGKGAIAKYFQQFLGSDDSVIASSETNKLVTVLKSFAKDNFHDANEHDSFLQHAFNYLGDLSRSRSEFTIDGLANRLYPENPGELQSVLSADDLQLADGFIPNPKALKSLVKLKAQSQHWKLEFDRAGLSEGSIVFNAQNNTLTLSGLSQAVIAELTQESENA